MIIFLFQLLFFFTPIIFSTVNSEYFELPKMYFVYSLTALISFVHFHNYLSGQSPLFKKNVFTWPLLAFLSTQLISTIFSIDIHTSIFGYYSRLNGGLLSLISYSILFFILSVYINDHLKNKIISVSLYSGLLIATYGILEHFGIDKHIWAQDVQARVFSTLGQPNWLAAYLCILLPFSLDRALFYFSQKKYTNFIFYDLLSTIYFVCLLYTKSKSGIIASVISLGILGLIYFIKNTNRLLLIAIYGLLISLSLLIPNPIKDIVFPLPASTTYDLRSTTLITPSEDIRKIVWQGSLDLWKQFPLFGTGPETFAYSYYWTRPIAHNLTSEWNFLYNKAHNEYLNYMATTGTFGIISYLVLILFFGYHLAKKSPVLFASFVSILITNAAGFSVVIVSLYFFLLPVLIVDNPASPQSGKRSFYWFRVTVCGLLFILIASKVLFYFLADITYSSANIYNDRQQYGLALDQIRIAIGYRNNEPIYISKYSDILAKIAITNKDKSIGVSADNAIRKAISLSPFNLNLWKESAQTYYYLATLESSYYLKALDALTKATRLAPTDAMSFYLLGKFYQNISANDQALLNYQQALALKPNYDYASFAIGKIYFDQKKYDEAKPLFEKTLSIAPSNIDAQNYLNIIATSSARHP